MTRGPAGQRAFGLREPGFDLAHALDIASNVTSPIEDDERDEQSVLDRRSAALVVGAKFVHPSREPDVGLEEHGSTSFPGAVYSWDPTRGQVDFPT